MFAPPARAMSALARLAALLHVALSAAAAASHAELIPAEWRETEVPPLSCASVRKRLLPPPRHCVHLGGRDVVLHAARIPELTSELTAACANAPRWGDVRCPVHPRSVAWRALERAFVANRVPTSQRSPTSKTNDEDASRGAAASRRAHAVRVIRLPRTPETDPEAYGVTLAADEIVLAAHGYRGTLWAIKTLHQILAVTCGEPSRRFPHPTSSDGVGDGVGDGAACVVKALEVKDRPAIPHRGLLLDVSRNRVPTREALRDLIDLLSDLKYNHLQLYAEHVLGYAEHGTVWEGHGAIAPTELRALRAYASERGVDMVPNQQSLAHMEKWLRHARYRRLSDHPLGFYHPFQWKGREPFGLSPGNASAAFLDALYAELAPVFYTPSGGRAEPDWLAEDMQNVPGFFHANLDEPFGLGDATGVYPPEVMAELDATEIETERAGEPELELPNERRKRQLYMSHFRRVHELLSMKRRLALMMWDDHLRSNPASLREVPEDVRVMQWGYEAWHNFTDVAARYAARGLRWWACAGTSAWKSFGGDIKNAFENIAKAAEAAVDGKNPAEGALLTDWGDDGHMNPPAASYAAYAKFAAETWLPTSLSRRWEVGNGMNAEEDERRLADAISLHVVGDVPTGVRDAVVNLTNGADRMHSISGLDEHTRNEVRSVGDLLLRLGKLRALDGGFLWYILYWGDNKHTGPDLGVFSCREGCAPGRPSADCPCKTYANGGEGVSVERAAAVLAELATLRQSLTRLRGARMETMEGRSTPVPRFDRLGATLDEIEWSLDAMETCAHLMDAYCRHGRQRFVMTGGWHGLRLLTELTGPDAHDVRPALLARLDALLHVLTTRVWPLRSKLGLGLNDTVERIRHTRHVIAVCAVPGTSMPFADAAPTLWLPRYKDRAFSSETKNESVYTECPPPGLDPGGFGDGTHPVRATGTGEWERRVRGAHVAGTAFLRDVAARMRRVSYAVNGLVVIALIMWRMDPLYRWGRGRPGVARGRVRGVRVR